MLAEKIVVLGVSALSLGTFNEADGEQKATFWIGNTGDEPVTLVQGYTSCGCTTIDFEKNAVIAPGDSTCVFLTFNPQGRGGEFLESGTIVYGNGRQRVTMTISGSCISSEETLLRQFPIRLADNLRVSADSFDLGIMSVGHEKTVNVVVLHRNQGDRRELIPVTFKPSATMRQGVHHVAQYISTSDGKHTIKITLSFRLQ